MHFVKSLSSKKSTQDKKIRFINGNELKLTHVPLNQPNYWEIKQFSPVILKEKNL